MTHESQHAAIGRLPEPLKIGEIFKAAEEQAAHGPEKLLTYVEGMQSFHAYAGEITLVMCRELRRTVGIASTVALRLALKFPERKVLIFNTYASADLLTSGFVHALHLLDMKVPFVFQKYLPKAEQNAFSDAAELPSPENLRVLDCPTATLTPESLTRDVERNGADIIILNSLEFAAFSDRRRKELAETLLELRHKKGISIFVFTHELRIILPYTGGRGAIGLLGAFSKSVWHLIEDWERRHWVNKLMIQLEVGMTS